MGYKNRQLKHNSKLVYIVLIKIPKTLTAQMTITIFNAENRIAHHSRIETEIKTFTGMTQRKFIMALGVFLSKLLQFEQEIKTRCNFHILISFAMS
jgi:hypothetical protein